MLRKVFGVMLVLAVCFVTMAPMAYAAESHPPLSSYRDEENPELPKVYHGETNFRQRYTEATRPADSSPINSVVDNPLYGNEFYFLTITNIRTNEAWRAGTAELVAGDQYLIEVFCRNDGTGKNPIAERIYDDVRVRINMPYYLSAGEVQSFGAGIVADRTTSVYTSIDVVSRSGISILYVEDSIRRTGDFGDHPGISYEELFTTGASTNMPLDAGQWFILSFAIQVIKDDAVTMTINPDVNYTALISPAGTGFDNAVRENAIQTTETTSNSNGTNGTTSIFTSISIGALAFSLGLVCGKKSKD